MSGGSADIRVGDIVSRCGDDRLRVTRTNGGGGELPDMIWVTCMDAGKGWGGFAVGRKDFLCADDVELIERPTRDPETISLPAQT